MYPVSQAFLTKIKENNTDHRLTGMVGGLPFTEENIVKGSFRISKQSTDSSDVVLGTCYVGQLNAEFTGIGIEWFAWVGKTITPSFGLYLGNNTWEDVPLGSFKIAKAKHTQNGVQITAYDAMTKFDKKFKKSHFTNLHTMYTIASRICSDCSVSLGMSNIEIAALPNGTRSDISIYGSTEKRSDYANDIETYRDLLYWVAQAMGCFATINRSGQLVFKQYTQTVVDNISDAHRIKGATFEDYITHYVGIYVENLNDNTEDYYGYNITALQAELTETTDEIEADQDRIAELVASLEEWDEKLEHGECTQAEYDAAVAEITAELHPLEIEVKQLSKRKKWLEKAIAAAGDDGADMVLGANPLLMDSNLTTRDTERRSVLGALDAITYTPFNASVVCGPHYDLGDVIQFSGGLYNSAQDTFGCVMAWTYTHNSGTVLQGFGVDPAIVQVRNKVQKAASKANTNATQASKIYVGETSPTDPSNSVDGKEGDMYIQETHPQKQTTVHKTYYGFQTYHQALNNLVYYTYSTLDVTSETGNFAVVFITSKVRIGSQDYTYCVAGSKSRKFGNVYFVKKVLKSDPVPEFIAEMSDFEEHNFPPPYPFQTTHLEGWGHSGGGAAGQFKQPTANSKIENNAHTHYYYYAEIQSGGTWIGGLRTDLSDANYTFDNMTDFQNACKTDSISIPDIYVGSDSTQIKYNDGSGGSDSWKSIKYVNNVSESEDAGGTENNGLNLNTASMVLSLKPNVVRAWYKADPPQTKRTFSQLCVRYTGSPDKQVNIEPYASHEWANSNVTMDDDHVYKIKCHGTYNSEALNYVVYRITGLVSDKKYYFNFRCNFTNNANFNYDMSKGCGLIFNTSGTVNTDEWSGDEDKFDENTMYYCFKRDTDAWYADFGFTALNSTMYMCVLMQAEIASSDVSFVMSEFVVSQKERELIRNIYMFDYTAQEWLKYKPFSGSTSGGDEGGSVVAIEPLTSQGTKIANFSIDGVAGELYAPDNTYTLPIASDEVLGGIKVGNNLEIDENGVLSATASSEVELVELTQAQYDVLTPEEKADPNIIYFITDGGGGGGGGSSTFAGLSDVSFSNLTNGQVPKYNATTQKWENANESGGGSIDYSTSEQRIGTWIDGKPLYQKTVTVPNTSAWSNNSTFSNGVSDADMIWVYDGFIYDNRSTQKFVYPNPMVQTTNRLSFNIDLNDKSKFKVSCDTTFSANADRYAVLTVRYTKTTD